MNALPQATNAYIYLSIFCFKVAVIVILHILSAHEVIPNWLIQLVLLTNLLQSYALCEFVCTQTLCYLVIYLLINNIKISYKLT